MKLKRVNPVCFLNAPFYPVPAFGVADARADGGNLHVRRHGIGLAAVVKPVKRTLGVFILHDDEVRAAVPLPLLAERRRHAVVFEITFE